MKRKFVKFAVSAMTALSAASFASITAFASDSAATNQQNAGGNAFLQLVVPMLAFLLILYFMAIRPQKKQEEQQKAMQDSLEIGDEVVTRDGSIGLVVRIGDDNVVIETGGDRNKIRFKKWAIAENISAAERMKEAAPKKNSNNPLSAAGLSSDSDDKKKKKDKE